MRKLKLEIEALEVESFAPSKGDAESGTVRGYLSAYYELCHEGDSWQNTCTCEPTCNAQTCYNCSGACSGACGTAKCSPGCNDLMTIVLTNCDMCNP